MFKNPVKAVSEYLLENGVTYEVYLSDKLSQANVNSRKNQTYCGYELLKIIRILVLCCITIISFILLLDT